MHKRLQAAQQRRGHRRGHAGVHTGARDTNGSGHIPGSGDIRPGEVFTGEKEDYAPLPLDAIWRGPQEVLRLVNL